MPRSEFLKDAEANSLNEQPRITLEIINPENVDENDDQIILYAVNDNADLDAKIEDDAPYNAGLIVTFKKCKFVAVPISISPDSLPVYSLKVQNIGEELLKHFRLATKSGVKTEVNIRIYLPSRALLGPEAETEFLTTDNISHSTSSSMIDVKFKVLTFLNNKVPREIHSAA